MKIKKSEPIKTILTISTGFIVVYLATKHKWALTVSLVLGIIGIVSAWLSEKIDYLWMKLAQLLGYIMPNVLLSVVFFIFLTPLAFLSKLFKKGNALQLKNTSQTTYITVDKAFDKASLENLW